MVQIINTPAIAVAGASPTTQPIEVESQKVIYTTVVESTISPDLASEDGFIEFFASGDSSTIIPFKQGDYSSDGRAKASLIQKIQTKVLSLGDSSDIYCYVGVTQSKEKLRDTLGTISSVIKYIGGVIPFPIASGVANIVSSLLQFWKAESPDVIQAAKFMGFNSKPIVLSGLGSKIPLLTLTTQSGIIDVDKYSTPKEYRLIVSNLVFDTLAGDKATLPSPTPINTTKGPRFSVGGGSSTQNISDWIKDVIGTMTVECQSPGIKTVPLHVPVNGTLQASWEAFEVLRFKTSISFIPLSLAFSMSPKNLNLAAAGDLVSSVLGEAPKFGVKIPSGVAKAAQPAFATLAGLFSDSLELFHLNGGVVLADSSVPSSQLHPIIQLKAGTKQLVQDVFSHGEKIGTFSFTLTAEEIGSSAPKPVAPQGNSIKPELQALKPLFSVVLPNNIPPVIDLYSGDYDPNANTWDVVAKSGVIGVIHKCTENTGYVDSRYLEAKKTIKAAKLLFGAYHFSRPGNPEKQAEHFLRTAGLEAGDIAALDVEPRDEKKGPSDCMDLEDCVIWAKYVEDRIKRKPLIYGGGNGLRELLKACRDESILKYLSLCPLWLAQYASTASVPRPWENFTLHQYAGDSQIVPGLTQCDLNHFSGTEDQLKAWWLGK